MKILISIDAGGSADTILRESLAFIKDLGDVDIHIFTVVDMAMVSVGPDQLDDTRFMNTLEHHAAKLNASVAHIMGDTQYTFSSEVGYPVDEILKKMNTIQCDLLILGTHAHSAFDHLLNAGIVDKVLRHAACKTLVIPIKKDAGV